MIHRSLSPLLRLTGLRVDRRVDVTDCGWKKSGRAVCRGVKAAAALLATGTILAAADPNKVTYEDDVLPIFRDNCLKCHNPDKLKGDLDLSSFSSALKGGGSGTTLNASDPDGSQLFKSITQVDEPAMPPNSKLADKDIATIRKWIEGGLLQGAGSKAITANKPAVNLALKSTSIGKPTGPPPMPAALPLEPVVRAVRGSALSAIATSPWAPVVALAGARQIVLYHSTDLEFLGVLAFPEGLACDVKFSRNGKLLIAAGGRGGQSGVVVAWDVTTGQRVISIGDQYDSVIAADVSPDQQRVALGGPDRVLKIYQTADGSLEHRIKKHNEWVTAVEFSPDGRYLASGDRHGGLFLWEAETGQEMYALPGHKGAITAITWRGDSEVLLSASEDGTLKLWKAGDGSALRSIPGHTGGALSARFTHDGRIVSSGRDNKVQIWDATGKNVRTLPFSGDLPNRVTFNDDGQRVIGSDWKGAVFVWDAKTGRVLGELDATPPTLAERVAQGAERLAPIQAAATAATETLGKAEAEAKLAQSKLTDLKKSLDEARARFTSTGGSVIKISQRLADDPANVAAQKELAAARILVETLERKIAMAPREISEATQRANAAARKIGELKATADQARARLAAAEAALARWQAALRDAQAEATSGRVSAR